VSVNGRSAGPELPKLVRLEIEADIEHPLGGSLRRSQFRRWIAALASLR
jgi:hypothetical protein